MELCTKLSDRVLNLETTKTNQAMEIDSLKRRVKNLEKKQEDQGRYNDQEMFDTWVLDDEEVVVKKEVADKEVGTVKEVGATQDQ
nr:hypothetical protein [Tanacetum cinerariifolium]